MNPTIKLKSLRSDSVDDHAFLQKALESAPSYWMRVSAQLPLATAAEEMFRALPDGNTYDDKFVLGILNPKDEMIGCLDWVRGYPDSETGMLGLLLISESEQRKGNGMLAYEELEKMLLSGSGMGKEMGEGIRKIRVGVISTNEIVLPFWKSLGFVETGLRRPYEENGIKAENIVLEKPLKRLQE